MKQCAVPRCGYVGDGRCFEPVFVPEKPYRPSDLVVKCPGCGRRAKFSDLKEQLSEFEQQKRAAAADWELMPAFRAEVMERMGWRGVKRREELREDGRWWRWHERTAPEDGIIGIAVREG